MSTIQYRFENDLKVDGEESPVERTDPLTSLRQREEPPQEERSLAKLLRVVGTLLLLAAAAAFMIQSWPAMSFQLRYLAFLAFTVVLAGAGVYCAVGLKEDKGARSFLGIAAAFLPAHFVQLGALIYHGKFGVPPGLNPFFVVTTPDLSNAYFLAALGLPVLATVSFFAFSALLRPEAKLATVVYLLANTVLLIPTRDPNLVGTLSLLVFALLTAFSQLRLNGKAIMTSKEGMICRALFVAPYLLLLGRSLFLYQPSAWLQCTTYLAGTVVMFIGSQTLMNTKDAFPRFCQFWAERLTFAGAGLTWGVFANRVVLAHGNELSIPFTFLPMAILFFGLSFRVQGEGRGYRRLAAWLAVSSVLVQLTLDEGILSSAICLFTAVIITASAHQMRDRGMFLAGVSGLAYGVLYHIKYAARFYAFSPWFSLAVIGTLVLLSSSYLERHWPRLLESGRRMRQDLENWH